MTITRLAAGWRYANVGNDGFTKLLLHMQGANASTTFTDSSASAHTMTANGSAQIDTSKAHFPTAGSLKVAANTDNVTTPDSTDFQFGTGDFTIDCWAFMTANNKQDPIASSLSGSPGSGWAFDIGYNIFSLATVGFSCWSAGVVQGQYTTSINRSPISLNTWHHVAVVRSLGDFFLFLDGTSRPYNVGADLSGATIPLSGSPLTVGARTSVNSLGWLQELRISKGIARWTANFTPPDRPYS